MLRVVCLLVGFGVSSIGSSALADTKSDCSQVRDISLSIKACSLLIKQNPKIADPYMNRAAAYLANDQLDGAIADLGLAIKFEPKAVDAFHSRATAFYLKRDFDRAISDLTKIVELSPNDALAYTHRGIIYGELGAFQKAIADHNRAIELDSKSAQAFNSRGTAYAQLQEYDHAIADFKKAIRLAPDDSTALDNLALAEKERGEPAEPGQRSQRAAGWRKRTMDMLKRVGKASCAFLPKAPCRRI